MEKNLFESASSSEGTTRSQRTVNNSQGVKLEKPLTSQELKTSIYRSFLPKGCIFDREQASLTFKTILDTGDATLIKSVNAAIDVLESEHNEKYKGLISDNINISEECFLSSLKEKKDLYNLLCSEFGLSELNEGLIKEGAFHKIWHYKESEGYLSESFTLRSSKGKSFSKVLYYENIKANNVKEYLNALFSYRLVLRTKRQLTNDVRNSDELLLNARKAIKDALNAGYDLDLILKLD